MTDIAAKSLRLSIGLALLLSFAGTAQAKRVFNDRVPIDSPTLADDAVMYPGPVGAMLEANYFRAPPADASGIAQCRLRLYFSNQPLRLARSCE